MPLVSKPTGLSPRSTSSSIDVVKGLASSSHEERWAAARRAAERPELAADLAARLSVESHARVREAMLTSLARMGTAQIVQHVAPLLRSSDAALRSGALVALSSSAAAVREVLPGLLRDPEIDVRILSCELARALPNEEATRLLGPMLLEEQDINAVGAAIDVLAEVGGPEAVRVLTQCGQRFAAVPFICFAIKAATERLLAQSEGDRD